MQSNCHDSCYKHKTVFFCSQSDVPHELHQLKHLHNRCYYFIKYNCQALFFVLTPSMNLLSYKMLLGMDLDFLKPYCVHCWAVLQYRYKVIYDRESFCYKASLQLSLNFCLGNFPGCFCLPFWRMELLQNVVTIV